MRRTLGHVAAGLAAAVLLAACGSTQGDPALDAADAEVEDPTADAGAAAGTAGAAADGVGAGVGEEEAGTDVAAEEGTAVPLVPQIAGNADGLAEQIEEAERTVRDPATPAHELAAAAHEQQVAYRVLAATPAWHDDVLAELPDDLQDAARHNLAARLEFTSMNANPPENVPAWRVVTPAPADELRSYYEEGEDEYGIEWEYLAAINLVETGMGRIRGDSSAGAQGPMQFIPSTWARFGEGDVTDPHDAILAAARYLAHNGGADGNIDGALFNYNNDVRYVRGVMAYAAVMAEDPAAYRGFHQWQIWYASAAGDLLLPEGYHLTEPQPATQYAATHPTRLRT